MAENNLTTIEKKEVKEMISDSIEENTKGLTKKEKRKVSEEIYKNMTEKLKAGAEDVKSEFKKQISGAIIAAFGFLMALSWRELINFYIKELMGERSHDLVVSTAIITFIAVIGILVVSKWAKKESK